MKKVVLFLFVVFLSVEVGVAQRVLDEDEKAAVLDSLRYYPITGNDYFKYNNLGPTVGLSFYKISKTKIMYRIFSYDYFPVEYYIETDSINGRVNRNLYDNEGKWFHSNNSSYYFTIEGNWIFDKSYYLSNSEFKMRKITDTSYVERNTNHTVEQLYFSTPPSIGDTVIRGSSQFGVEIGDLNMRDSTYSVQRGDGIPYTIYRGYMEKKDRELEFENPQDTVIQMIQFQNDELIYTLAKDIGLIHIDRIVPNGDEEIIERILELSTATIGDREMKRPKYVVVSTEEEPHAPTEFQLHANRPNPFNPSTELSFTLQQAQTVSLEVTDMLGRRMSLPLSQQRLSAGTHRVTINAQRWASGVYFYHLSTELGSATKKMLLVK